MLRSQCILYGRYPAVLGPFKYAGYPLLLEVLRQQGAGAEPTAAAAAGAAGGGGVGGGGEAAGGAGAAGAADGAGGGAAGGGGAPGRAAAGPHFLSGESTGLVQAAVELCWLTCVASALNAEELLRCGGCAVLARLLSRCVGIMPLDVAPNAPEAAIATHALRTLAGLASVEAARREMAGPAYGQLLADAVRCCGLERAHGAVEAALVLVCQLAAAPELQASRACACGLRVSRAGAAGGGARERAVACRHGEVGS
jgi:DnaJ homolog subfamily C member 13